MEYKLVRLSNGEEVIGQVTETENQITIKDGHALFAPEPGKIGFIPFMPYTKAKEGVTVDKQFVMFVVDPLDSLVDQIKGKGSRIMTPKKDIIV
tara:strand:- start:142 stop:423 length:282 start_codon:yes stop_codon:yes gene_type:complete